jgi:hypothetical protein
MTLERVRRERPNFPRENQAASTGPTISAGVGGTQPEVPLAATHKVHYCSVASTGKVGR